MAEKAVSAFWKSIREVFPGLTDARLVKKLRKDFGVSQPTVSRWKSGKPPIGGKTALRIAQKYNVNSHWLRTHEGDRLIASEDDPYMKRLREALDGAPDQDKEDVVGLAEIKARRRHGASRQTGSGS